MNLIATAQSALAAFSRSMDATANNIANARTPGFKATRSEFQARPEGGVDQLDTRDERPGPYELLPGDGTDSAADAVSHSVSTPPGYILREGSNVDLANELVNLRQAQLAFEVNAHVLRRGLDTLGGFIDEFA